MSGISVRPYWELTFDADGDPDTGQRDRLAAEAAGKGVTDLVVFAHGWNSDRSTATSLYDRFFALFPELVRGTPGVRLGYAGVLWPSMRFSDEPIPDFEPSAVDTRHALATVFPGCEPVVARLDELLSEQPADPARLAEFTGLVRQLVRPADGCQDLAPDDHDDGEPAILRDDPLALCEAFSDALETCGGDPALLGGGPPRLWNGGRELLRQATYYAMKRRAGTVGERGLGPALGRIARAAPSVRIHLVGHSFGARLVSFALRGLPDRTRGVKSLTLLQGAFSHHAFAPAGALHGMQSRVDGPVVACFSRHDSALGVMYPLASRMARDDRGVWGAEPDGRWGAIGYGGFQAVTGTKRVPLAEALLGGLPARGCVSVDAGAVVRRGGPPGGAHCDILHAELARAVLAAGRVVPTAGLSPPRPFS